MTNETTVRAWYAMNEVIDDEGFFLEGEAAFEAERAELAGMGAPDTDAIAFVSYEPEDRDEAIVEATGVTDALWAWLQDNAAVFDDDE